MQQSAIFPIYLRAEYRNDGQGFVRFESEAARAARAAKREFDGVRAAVDQALARQRNSFGSLDLGVDEMRRAAQAQQQVARAAREVAEATKRAAIASGTFDTSMSRATRAAFELASAEERASRELLEQVAALDAVQRELNQTASATDLVTAANQRNANSAGASRTAFIQLGQQMQDVAVQAQLGTNAFIIFGQQVPQAAFALSGLADSANRTQARIGQIATFLSGPWGAAIFIAIAALGPLVQKLFETGDEADKARTKAFNFADGLDVLKLSAEDATAAMDQLSSSLRSAITLQGDFLRGGIAIARQSATRLQAQIDADQAELSRIQQQRSGIGATLLPSIFGPSSEDRSRERQLRERLRANREALGPALEAAGVAAVAEANRNIAEAADPLLAQINAIDDAIARLNRRRERTVTRNDVLADDNISQAEFERQLSGLAKRRAELEEQQRESRRTGSTRTPRERVNREPEQLARFADQAAERVARINDRFAEQTRLVTQSLTANRELDSIIAETNRRMEKAKNLTAEQRKEFEGIISSAEAARDTIDEALRRPFEDLTRESEQRLEVERLLAQGKVDEAAALQEVVRIEQQLGTAVELRAALQRAINEGNATEADRIRNLLSVYDDLLQGARDRVIAEQQLTREYRAQQALFQAQLDVVQTVRRDLTDLLSGRSNDFFKNFRQALQDLQGQRLFEDLFGKAFRDIEEQLRGNTPLGRANAAYTAEVEKTVSTTSRLEGSLDSLDGAVRVAAERLRTGAAANDNIISSSAGARASVAQELLRELGIGTGITVTGGINPKAPQEIGRRSTKEIADAISRSTVEGFLSPLRDILGEKFFNGMAGVLGDVLSAYVRGGEAGAVFEGLSKAANAFGAEGLGAAFSQASLGAEVGTQVAGISKALGLGGSTTGAQIGGALGSFAGPIGTVVGAIAGNIIGGLVKATKRGSATIGNLGGELAIVGTRGNSRSRIEQSTGLAGSALDAIQNIAQQLGANVDAARGSVSIGVRNNNIRVDTSGRGITKTSRGAIDFGEDAEAAVRAAVLDLIQDGVITGLRQSEERLLRAGDDIEAALRDVLTFRSVFDRLQELKDPLGFAITQLNREFEQLIDLFERAGASSEEFAQLEELYNLQRAQAIEDATDRVVGSLRQLLNELTIGDSGLSLRSRRSNALGQFNGLAARVAAGDASAFDDFADISQQLLDIERQLFGSTQSYFDRLAQITRLTEEAIADQTNVTSIGAVGTSATGDQAAITRSIDVQTSELASRLDAIIANQVAAVRGLETANVSGGGRSSGPFPALIANF